VPLGRPSGHKDMVGYSWAPCDLTTGVTDLHVRTSSHDCSLSTPVRDIGKEQRSATAGRMATSRSRRSPRRVHGNTSPVLIAVPTTPSSSGTLHSGRTSPQESESKPGVRRLASTRDHNRELGDDSKDVHQPRVRLHPPESRQADSTNSPRAAEAHSQLRELRKEFSLSGNRERDLRRQLQDSEERETQLRKELTESRHREAKLALEVEAERKRRLVEVEDEQQRRLWAESEVERLRMAEQSRAELGRAEQGSAESRARTPTKNRLLAASPSPRIGSRSHSRGAFGEPSSPRVPSSRPRTPQKDAMLRAETLVGDMFALSDENVPDVPELPPTPSLSMDILLPPTPSMEALKSPQQSPSVPVSRSKLDVGPSSPQTSGARDAVGCTCAPPPRSVREGPALVALNGLMPRFPSNERGTPRSAAERRSSCPVIGPNLLASVTP